MPQVVEINAIEHLESIRLRWTSLFYETRHASFFHTLDWLGIYWRHYRDRQRLKVLLVHRAGNVLGILPLVVSEELTTRGFAKVLTYPTIHSQQFLGPIGRNPTATLITSLRFLARERRDWDVLALPSIGEHDHGRTQNAMQLAELCHDVVTDLSIFKTCFDSPPHSSLPDTAPRLSEIHSTHERLKFTRIRSVGINYDQDEALDSIANACFELLEDSTAVSKPTLSRGFFCEMIATAHRLGMLDLNLLSDGEDLVAFAFNVHLEGELRQVSAAESSVLSETPAGQHLASRMLQDSITRRDECFYGIAMPECSSGIGSTEKLPVVRYEHREFVPLRVRIEQLSRRLLSPLTHV